MNALAPSNEKELLNRLRSGDGSSFDQIFHSFYPSLCYFANRLLADRSIAEEIVQDALFQVWQKQGDFYSFQSLKAFLYISTRNACYNHIKKERSKTLRLETMMLDHEPDETTVLHTIIETEVFAELYQAIEALPEQCRKIMSMIVDGQKPRDIAAELGVTVSTVNSQKMRGVGLLKARLSGEGLATLLIIISGSITRH
ncbi:RNA polymerase sigma-70 factor (ECF subfamily) [Mucilaginibacter gracilis]|uniref:RNA polymerase sigma-70 factor (ECF subfamily) n=1 Tax=Mucilaginibacter gracilis TaxID=423350 RepID=A0A495J602_9SPHI|nr:RNA polymerase sigma-70 factor [Mucilaginibacter gracilis]RKR84420.1 RNA polymerase sigma-70 factor (ECF subfamily) [Mucilaginibacter gracilis]